MGKEKAALFSVVEEETKKYPFVNYNVFKADMYIYI